jgi:hypothetical protein
MLSRKLIGFASDNDKRYKYIVRENEAFLNVAPGCSKYLNYSLYTLRGL